MKFVVLDQVGTHTIVVLEANEGSLAAEILGKDAWGIGESRALPSDHFDSQIGISLATARAIQDMGRKLEESAQAAVQTKQEYVLTRLEEARTSLIDAAKELRS